MKTFFTSRITSCEKHINSTEWPHSQQQLARDLEVERAVMRQGCRPQSFGEVQRCNTLLYVVFLLQLELSRSSSLTDQLVRKLKDSLGINIMKIFFTLYITSCEKHSTEWRLPRWCPQRRSPLMPSRTDSSNLHVMQRWNALSWGSAVGLKVAARCSDAIRRVCC